MPGIKKSACILYYLAENQTFYMKILLILACFTPFVFTSCVKECTCTPPPTQKTITSQPGPTDGNDAYTSYLASDPSWANGTNTLPEITTVTWTNGGAISKSRGYVSFNLDEIPSGAHIDSARLYIYGISSSVNAPQGNSGDNRLYIQRVLSSWSENTITWNNAPATSEENQVTTPATTTTWNADINVSVTSMVQDMINENKRYGFSLKLINDVPYASIVLGSSETTDPTKRPKLVVTYTK